jgi:hypothetical protein
VAITPAREAYLQLVAMLNTSSAEFKCVAEQESL